VSEDPSRAAWLRQARSHLRQADPVLARLIDDRPDFDPRAWLECGHVGCCDNSPGETRDRALPLGQASGCTVVRTGRGLVLVLS
jgi:hypothetical protein